MKKGINFWTFPKGTPLVEAAKQARDAGFETIEPVLDEHGEITQQTDETTCRALAEAVRDQGLEISSLACGMFWSTPYTSKSADIREQAKSLTLHMLDRAAWLGTDVILVVPGIVSHFARRTLETPYADALHYAFDALRTLAPEAEDRGVVIAIENVWNQFLVSPCEMRDLIDRLNSPWVGVYFDVGNTLRYGLPEDWVRTLGQRICRVHLKDFQLDVGNVKGFCPLGEGDVDWPATMLALKETGYDGPLTFEGPGDLSDISRRMDAVTASH